MSNPVTLVASYPPDTKFDVSYYVNTHMKMTTDLWAPLGLKSWKVRTFGPGAPWKAQVTLEWNTVEERTACYDGPHLKTIMDDVPNFADKEPQVVMGELAGSWQA